MNQKLSGAGAYILINKMNSKYYYVASQNLSVSIKEQLALLEEGLHDNTELQRDFTAYTDQAFTIMVIMQEIDIESAEHIVDTLLAADMTAYNHPRKS